MNLLILLLFLALPLIALVPFIVGLILLVRRKRKAGIILLIIYGCLIGAVILYAENNKRSRVGHLVRWCLGAGLLQQEVEDMVEDMQHSVTLPKMHSWANDTLQRFRSGLVKTNGPSEYWSIGSVRLSTNEVPEFVWSYWKAEATLLGHNGEYEAPEISISVSDAGEPKSLVIAWYSIGVTFGDTNYPLPLDAPNFQQEIIPAVYAYCWYK